MSLSRQLMFYFLIPFVFCMFMHWNRGTKMIFGVVPRSPGLVVWMVGAAIACVSSTNLIGPMICLAPLYMLVMNETEKLGRAYLFGSVLPIVAIPVLRTISFGVRFPGAISQGDGPDIDGPGLYSYVFDHLLHQNSALGELAWVGICFLSWSLAFPVLFLLFRLVHWAQRGPRPLRIATGCVLLVALAESIYTPAIYAWEPRYDESSKQGYCTQDACLPTLERAESFRNGTWGKRRRAD